MKKQIKKIETIENVLGEDFYYGTSINNVLKNLSKDEKKLRKEILERKSQKTTLRTKVIANMLLHRKNGTLSEEQVAEFKKISFEDAEANVLWHAIQYKAENDTTLSVMDLYASGYNALITAWSNFMVKDEKTIEKNIRDDKMPFASFKTFSEPYIKNSIACEIIKQKAIDNHTFDMPKTAKFYSKKVSIYVQSIICMTGKMPSCEEIAANLDISVRTVKSILYILEIGGKSEEDIQEAEILKDLDFSTVVCEDLNPMEKTIQEASKNAFWAGALEVLGERNYEILSKYFVKGETLQNIANEYGLSKERVRQIIDESEKKIKNNPSLLETLIDSARK